VDTRTDVEQRDVKPMMAKTIVQRRTHLRYRMCVAAAVAATSVLMAASTAWAATGGYGPGAPGNSPPPGGFSVVVAARTIGPKGTHLVLEAAGAVAVVDVAPKTFPSSVILKITIPDLGQVTSGASSLGFPNTKAVAGIGVYVLTPNGKPAPSPFAKPIAVTLYGPLLGAAGEHVVNLTGPTTATPIGANIGLFHVGFSVTGDVNVAVLNPVAKRHGSGTGGNSGGRGSNSIERFGALSPAATAPSSTGSGPSAGAGAGEAASGSGSIPSANSWMTATPVISSATAGRSAQSAIDSVVTSNDGVSSGSVIPARSATSVIALGALAILIGLAAVALWAAKRGPGTVPS
jgi:hypothetical protein